MQRQFPKIWVWLALVAFFGCERVVEYGLPGATPRLVVNSLICEDSLVRIEVSISASPGDGAKIQSLRDAKSQSLKISYLSRILLWIPCLPHL